MRLSGWYIGETEPVGDGDCDDASVLLVAVAAREGISSVIGRSGGKVAAWVS